MVTNVLPFYERVFDWTTQASDGGDQPYYEFQHDGKTVLGALEMPPELPSEVPAYWLIYFDVEDVDAAFRRAVELGAGATTQRLDSPGSTTGRCADARPR